MKISTGLYGLFIFMLIGCNSAKIESKKGENAEAYETLKTLLETGKFEIEHQWLFPMRSGQQVSLIGNPNHIQFYKDSVSVYLPYFGVRQLGANMQNEGGIKYEGIAENIEYIENEAKNSITIRFEANPNMENLLFDITVYTNKKASTQVVSSNRDNISYRGDLQELSSKE